MTPISDNARLRMVLAENLRVLCDGKTPVAEICRQIGVNRTQFNRYLNGLAFPRPDVLHRICRHFHVDANILLQPLHGKPTPKEQGDMPAPLTISHGRPFDHYLLPDGAYCYWRKSFRQPSRAYMGLAIIHTKGERKLWSGYDIHDEAIREGGKRFARSTRYEGELIQQFDGFAVLSNTPFSGLMNMSYFEYGLDGMQDYYSGMSFITRRRLPDTNRMTAIVMRHLPDDCGTWLDVARKAGTMKLDALPPVVRAALKRIPDRL